MRPPWRPRRAPDVEPAIQALIDAVRQNHPVLVYQCGCMPCPEHAAAHERRRWERAMHDEMRRGA